LIFFSTCDFLVAPPDAVLWSCSSWKESKARSFREPQPPARGNGRAAAASSSSTLRCLHLGNRAAIGTKP
jgi:hypothetical protein